MPSIMAGRPSPGCAAFICARTWLFGFSFSTCFVLSVSFDAERNTVVALSFAFLTVLSLRARSAAANCASFSACSASAWWWVALNLLIRARYSFVSYCSVHVSTSWNALSKNVV
jgi:hypothetical protein